LRKFYTVNYFLYFCKKKLLRLKKNYNIPIFIPELACPFQCIFCNQKNISGRLEIPKLEEVRGIIERNLSTIDFKNSNVEIAFFGGNFTGIDLEIQENLLKEANYFIEKKFVNGIRISTRPDYIDENKLNLLKKYNVKTIELGAQSIDKEVLKLSGRGHKVEDIENASKLIIDSGFNLGLQMMIGLPGDTLEKSIYTAKKIIGLGAENTRIYPTLVIKDTALEKLFLQKKYFPLSIDEAVTWVKEIYKIFESSNVKIIRTGLHPSEGLLNGNSFLAGPFHQSFKELVLTEIWNEKLSEIENSFDRNKIEIFINPKEINSAAGYNSKNKLMLNKKFAQVKFKFDNSLKEREFRVNYC